MEICVFRKPLLVAFNLNEDPYEEASLAQNNEYRRERQKAIVRLKQWVADTGDKFSIPED
jgi:hypothetical protein